MKGLTAEMYVSKATLITFIICKKKIPVGINHILFIILPLNAITKMLNNPKTLIPLQGSPIQTP